MSTITVGNPTVITFGSSIATLYPVGYYVTLANFTQDSQWSALNLVSCQIISAVGTQLTLNLDTSSITTTFNPASNPFGPVAYVLNEPSIGFGDQFDNDSYSNNSITPLPYGQWVNLLCSWDMNQSAGSKKFSLYYGDTPIITPSRYIEDTYPAFSAFLSDPTTFQNNCWYIGGSGLGSPFGVACYMAEYYFNPGAPYMDFSNPSNRALFHDLNNRPVSLGSDGSLPTGSKPIVYLTLPFGDTNANDFAKNATGNGPLRINVWQSLTPTLSIAPTSP